MGKKAIRSNEHFAWIFCNPDDLRHECSYDEVNTMISMPLHRAERIYKNDREYYDRNKHSFDTRNDPAKLAIFFAIVLVMSVIVSWVIYYKSDNIGYMLLSPAILVAAFIIRALHYRKINYLLVHAENRIIGFTKRIDLAMDEPRNTISHKATNNSSDNEDKLLSQLIKETFIYRVETTNLNSNEKNPFFETKAEEAQPTAIEAKLDPEETTKVLEPEAQPKVQLEAQPEEPETQPEVRPQEPEAEAIAPSVQEDDPFDEIMEIINRTNSILKSLQD